MFSMNVPNWKDGPFVREHFRADSIERLEAQLKELASKDMGSTITRMLRQMVFERRSGSATGSLP
jgi:hypothetical protein